MWNCLELFLASILLCLFLQTTCIFIINFFYLTVPWIIWGGIAVYILIIYTIRIPPPSSDAVSKVLGLNPLNRTKDDDDILNEDYIDTTEGFYMQVIAHRGAGFDYPENSLSAFLYSYRQGCDAIEFDVSLTKDNIPIVFHDETVDRLSGLDGIVKEMTWSELKVIDISANHPLRSKFHPDGERIALFEDVLVQGLNNDQHMFIDIKIYSNEMIQAILNAFQKYPQLYEKAVITTFNPLTVYSIRRKDPAIIAGIAWRPQIYSMVNYSGLDGPSKPRYDNIFKHFIIKIVDVIHEWALKNITYYILGISFILLHKDIISAEAVRIWNKRGIRPLAWTVNLPTEKVHIKKNLKVPYLTDTLLS